MVNSSDATVRQMLLCASTFVAGIACAILWQTVSSTTLSPVGTLAIPAPTTEFAWPSVSFDFLLGVLAIVLSSALALVFGMRLATAQSEDRVKAAEEVLTTGSRLAQDTITNTEDRAAIDEARIHVERQLAELVGFVGRYLEQTSDQASNYANAQSHLTSASSVEQVQTVIKLLIDNTTSARRNADDLKVRLVESQAKSASLQASLVKAETLATIDGLTGLPNRRHFQNSLENQIATSHRERTPLSLVIADLDHFKAINDKFGHLSGDVVLKNFALILAKGVRSTDIAARYGGEEFALILPKTPLGNASFVAEALRRAVAEARWTGAHPNQRLGRITASFGVAEIREDETVEQLIERADQKLYEAKRKGRNRVELDHTSDA
jgi:diguanylate cyclase